MLRTHNCGQLTINDLNTEVTLCGRVDTVRKLGGMTFIDLRDRYGITQIKIDPAQCHADLDQLAQSLKNEFVIKIQGRVIKRPEGMANNSMITGAIEVQPTTLTVLSTSKELPFPINQDQTQANEDLRLEYRYLDLRRSAMQQNLITRHKITKEIFSFFDAENFLYIETPTFIKNTPEGAREYVVPVRNKPGNFYVLPQSPQQLKQLSMVAGLDKYFQLARCYRDEDLRGDRQPEFTQLDLEMSFVEQEDIVSLLERHFLHLSKILFPAKKLTFSPFQRMTWDESMEKYGIDKPELRTQALQLIELTDRAHKSDFAVFKNANCIKAIVADKIFTRSEIDNKITPPLLQKGSKGVAYLIFDGDEIKGPVSKFFSPELLKELQEKTGFGPGKTIFFQAGNRQETCSMLGFLRTMLIKELNLLEGKEDELAFAFVVDFPLYELDENGNLDAAHQPFTKPKDKDLEFVKSMGEKLLSGESLSETDKQAMIQLRADCYDLVLNGYELGSGSIRITDPELQKSIFAILGLSDAQIQERFGHILTAFSYGVPPHGGFAYGLDRVVMIYQNQPNIREIIAYPKNGKGEDLMLHAPSTIDEKILKDLGISFTESA
ncbi:MAG TPA: aspartate--tRNA ligase [Candidatus Absconditabacterales bacterium]|nr:aspartate--tRNA ligase [Candidatus Absconditabacterales bacterium]HMT26706.1 aspartate--tRNA ligase [Candidatus Absconditabacterales bacterium]